MTTKRAIAFNPPCLPYLNLGSINKKVIVANTRDISMAITLKCFSGIPPSQRLDSLRLQRKYQHQ